MLENENIEQKVYRLRRAAQAAWFDGQKGLAEKLCREHDKAYREAEKLKTKLRQYEKFDNLKRI